MQLSRIASFFFFLLSTTFFVCASPVASPNELAKRGGENDDIVLSLLTDLQAKVDVIIPQLDVLSTTGGDPTALLAQISADVDICVAGLIVLAPDVSHDWTDPKKQQIAALFVKIIVDLVVVLGKFPITIAFLLITATVDIFLNKLLLALDLCIVGIVVFAAPLVTSITIFIKLQLFLTLGIFGIPH